MILLGDFATACVLGEYLSTAPQDAERRAVPLETPLPDLAFGSVVMAALAGRLFAPDVPFELEQRTANVWRRGLIAVDRSRTATALRESILGGLTLTDRASDGMPLVVADRSPTDDETRWVLWLDAAHRTLWTAGPPSLDNSIGIWWSAIRDWVATDDATPLGACVPPLDARADTLDAWESGPTLPPSPFATPSGETLVDRLRQLASSHADQIAVEAHDGRWTYAELYDRAMRASAALARRGVAAGTRVAVQLPRSRDLPVAWLAVLGANGSVVPLDPEDETSRVAVMLASAGVVGCIGRAARDEGHDRLHDQPCWTMTALTAPSDGWPDDARARAADAPVAGGDVALDAGEHEASVMFTSGTTGVPKGIRIPHRAILRLVDGAAFYAPMGPGARVLGFAPAAFDASTFEMWGALASGATLCYAPPGPLSLDALTAHLVESQCTIAWLTAGLLEQLVSAGMASRLRGLTTLLTGGDVVPPGTIRALARECLQLRVINGYGPTENTTFTTCHIIADVSGRQPVPIGRPVAGTRVRVATPEGTREAPGAIGELWTSGAGLCLGYLDRSGDDPFVTLVEGDTPVRWYRTGDLARWRPDGTLAFHGRADRQVKLGGHRVEPEEVERWLTAQPQVREAAVVVVGDGALRRLAAAIVWRTPPASGDALAELIASANAALPTWLRPSPLRAVPEIPVTRNGKRDRRALAELLRSTPGAGASAIAPAEPSNVAAVQRVFATVLGVQRIGADDSFFDAGGTSLAALQLLSALSTEVGLRVSLGDFFADPTPAGVLRRTTDAARSAAGTRSTRSTPTRGTPDGGRDGIAIIGMAGRFPGAPSADALWAMSRAGRDSITRFRPDELDPLVPRAERQSPEYVAARGILPDIDQFPAAFFGITPAQADLMDPQLRVLLMLAWEALEQAGHPPDRAGERVGVFAGMNTSGYLRHHVLPHVEGHLDIGSLVVQFATEKDYVATGIAHRLDLRGPAISINTACSTSLVAIAQACESLWRGQCDAALAGGVSLTVPQRSGHLYRVGEMLSADGTTRPFDAAASGTVFSDGAAIVVLKRLSDAERDGDTIHAVIRGVAVNNDGAAKASFTAPSVDGQAAVVRQALDDAGWSAADLGFVETHGTATPLGDPIEVEALARVFREDRAAAGQCALGARKANIGHTTIAAGAAGLITATCAVRDGIIPPIAHLQSPNASLGSDAADFPFRLPTRAEPWPATAARRAGVSAFGVGGTNAHVVLEAYRTARPAATTTRVRVFPLSAPTVSALETLAARVGDALADPSVRPDDAAYTLAVGRRAMSARMAVAIADSAEWSSAASNALRTMQPTLPPDADVVFVCPGQGAQRLGMAAGLADVMPVFDSTCRALLRTPGVPASLLSQLFDAPRDDAPRDDAPSLDDTALAQPALVAFQIAMAAQWAAWGIRPTVVLGHSVGEIAAAAIAGWIRADDAVRFAALRGAAMQQAPRGRMLALRADAARAASCVSDSVAWAADNGPMAQTLAGDERALSRVAEQLAADGITTQWLKTSHAFHSPSLRDAVMHHLTPAVIPAVQGTPVARFVSTYRLDELPTALATPTYWQAQALHRVRFREGVLAAVRDAAFVLDLGPGTHAAGAARQTLAGRSAVRVHAVGDPAPSAAHAALTALGAAWCAGLHVDWSAIAGGLDHRRIPLPPTPLPTTRHWLAAGTPTTVRPVPDSARGALAAQRALIATQLELIKQYG